MENQDNEKLNKKLAKLENRLIEALKELYSTIDDCDTINHKRAADIFKAVIESMKERSKLLSENRAENSSEKGYENQLKNKSTRNQSNVIKVNFNETE